MSISNFFKKKQAEAIVEVVDDSPIFGSKEDYLAMRQAWKDYINEKKHLVDGGQLNSSHYLLYSLLRDQDVYKGFSEVTSPIKLANGHYKYLGLLQARSFLSYASTNTYTPYYIDIMLRPFGDTVTKEMIDRISTKISKIKLGWY